MSFKVTILGSGSAVPTSRRNPSSQYIECSNRHILIDCGEGTQMQFRKYGVKFQKIEYILISHLHGDHYFGLVGLLSTMHLLGRVKSIEIAGPRGLKDILDLQLNCNGQKLAFDINVNELEANEFNIIYEDEKICIEHFPLKHKISTTGFLITQKVKERTLLVDKVERDGVKIEFYHRLKKGENVVDESGKIFNSKDYTQEPLQAKRYAYCSDTRYTESILTYISKVDLLYHESTFTEGHIERARATQHSTALQAGMIAKKAGVGMLLLGHLSARYETGEEHVKEAKSVFENAIVVEDGECYLV